MKKKIFMFLFLFFLDKSEVTLDQSDLNNNQDEKDRKLYQVIQGNQYIPIQQQPILLQQPQTINPNYQTVIPGIQNVPIQYQQQPIVTNQNFQQNIPQIANIENKEEKVNQNQEEQKQNWWEKKHKKQSKDKQFQKILNSNSETKRKLEIKKQKSSEISNLKKNKKRKLFWWRRRRRRPRRVVRRRPRRRVRRRPRRRVRRIFRRRNQRRRVPSKPESYYRNKYPMPIIPKVYPDTSKELTDSPEECILFLEFLPMYYVSIQRKSNFRINFKSNCLLSKDIEFQTNFKKNKHLNIDSHPTQVKFFLFENFIELDYQEPEIIDEFDLMISKKYNTMEYKHKTDFKTIKVNESNSIFLKPEVRNSFNKYNLAKIQKKSLVFCKAKTKRIYKPGLPESVFWDSLEIPVLSGYQKYGQKGYEAKYMGKKYDVQKSTTILHPYNTKYYIEAFYYIREKRMKKGPYYDNYIRLPKNDYLVNYNNNEAYIKISYKSRGKIKYKVQKLIKFQHVFYYKTKKKIKFPVMIEGERKLAQKKKTKEQIQKEKELFEKKQKAARRKKIKEKYGSFQDLKELRQRMGVVKTEIMCYLT